MNEDKTISTNITCGAVTVYKLKGRNLSKPLLINITAGQVTSVEELRSAEDMFIQSIGACQKHLWKLVILQNLSTLFPIIKKAVSLRKKKASSKESSA